jgi:hypothetical protein
MELVLDDLTAQGVVVTVSAGNEADSHTHAKGSLTRAYPTRVDWDPVGQAENAIMDLWYSSDRKVSAILVTPSGEEVHGPTSASGANTPDGLVTIVSATTWKGNELAISVKAEGALRTYGWSVVLSVTDDGPPLSWDAWVDSDSCSFPTASFSTGRGYEIDENGTISIPATSNGAIAVGAYVTKNSWATKSGKTLRIPDYRVGEIAPFSSRGPTRDGRTKPDISAPGLFVAAARSIDVLPGDSDPDQYHRVLAGTSMAAPHVAGVVALMLQYSPSLTSQEVRSMLIEGAGLDDFTEFIDASVGSDEWGWGKADARTGTSLFRVSSTLSSLPAGVGVSLLVDGESCGLLNGGEVVTLRFLSGSVHMFEAIGLTLTANATRYVLADDRAVFSANGVFEPKMRVQYLLSLESSVGHAVGGGWYEPGSYASFGVEPSGISKGFAQLVGVDFSLDHWVDEHGNQLPTGSILMDSPHALKAIWRVRVADFRPALLFVGLVMFLILALEMKRGLLRKQGSAGLRRQPALGNRIIDLVSGTRHLCRR